MGERDGEGEDSRVKGGDVEALLAVAEDGLKANLGGRGCSDIWLLMIIDGTSR